MDRVQDQLAAKLQALGTLIRHERELVKEWTRPDMVRETGISDSTITRVERGEKVSLENLLAVASAVGIEIPSKMVADLTAPTRSLKAQLPPVAPPTWFTQYVEQQTAHNEQVIALLKRIARKTKA